MMKKTISLFSLVFLLLGIAQAQETKYIFGGAARQLALGGSPTNAYLMDYTDVNTNPAWAVKYADFVYAELGYNFAGYTASGQTIGFTYAIWKGLSVGLSVGKQEGPIFLNNSYGVNFGGQTANADCMIGGLSDLITNVGGTPLFNVNTPQNVRPLQIYGALKIGNLTVGAAVYRSSWSYSDEYFANIADTKTTKDEASLVQTGFKAGALLDMDVLLIDASALLRINSGKQIHTPIPPLPGSQNGTKEVSASGTEIAFNARVFMKLSDKFTLVPMARFSTFGYEPELKDTVQLVPTYKLNSKPNKYGRTEIEVGVGTNITVPGGRLFAGLSLESISLKNDVSFFRAAPSAISARDTSVIQTTKNTTSVLSLPKVNIGAEFDIASWLTGRIGYFKAFAGRTITTEVPGYAKTETKGTYDFTFIPKSNFNFSDQLLSVGLGIHFDRLALDGYLCEKWLADGPNIASGTTTDMFGVLSLSYSFN